MIIEIEMITDFQDNLIFLLIFNQEYFITYFKDNIINKSDFNIKYNQYKMHSM